MSEYASHASNPPAPTLASLRERLVQARYQRDWSQQELADLLGTTPLNVSRWERGLTSPNPYFRHKLCTLFGLSEIELGLRLDPKRALPPHEADKEAQRALLPLYDPFLPLPTIVPLVGRASLLAQLKCQLTTTRAVALSALHGLPGVGKTALALELAYDPELREHYPDGLLWAALGPQPNLLGLLSRWGKLLGINDDEAARLSTLEAWVHTLRATIGARRLLFVLDDAWSLEHALACQIGGAQCAYVLTTRLPQLAQSFTLTEAHTVGTLDEEESLELLRQLAPWAVEQAEASLRPLVRMLGGLPLALSLMGHYLRQQTHNRQPRRLQTALKRLQNRLTRLQLARPQMSREGSQDAGTSTWGMLSLEAVITISAEQLDARTRQAWSALSVLPPRPYSFSEEAALVVGGTSVEMLDELSDAGVLEAVGPARYTFHQVLADYGRAHLSAQEELEARKRLIDYSLQYASAYSDTYPALELEANVLTAALETCGDQPEDEALLRLTLALTPSWKARGDYALAERWLPRAREAASVLGQTQDEASVWVAHGDIATQQGDYAQAQDRYERGLALARQADNQVQVCASLTGVGWAIYKLGKYEQAEEALQEGLAIARQHGLQRLQAGLLRVLGPVTGLQGRLEHALAYGEEGLAIARQVSDHEITCALLNDLGVTYRSIGDIPQAVHLDQEGLAIARQRGYRYWEGLLLANLAAHAAGQGDYEQAERYAQEGLGLARRLGNLEHQCVALSNLALATNGQGNYEQAEIYAQEGLGLARRLSNPDRECVVLARLAEAANGQGNYKQAEIYAQEALRLARQVGNPDRECLALACLGESALARGEYKQAEIYAQEALRFARQVGNPEYICIALTHLGEAVAARGEYKQAEHSLQEGLGLARQLGDPSILTVMLVRQGTLALARREYEQAGSSLREGLTIARQMHLGPILWGALYQWGVFSLQQEQLIQATAIFQEMQAMVPEETHLERAQAWYGLARVAAALGKGTEARKLGTQALTTLEAIGHREAIQVRQWLEHSAF